MLHFPKQIPSLLAAIFTYFFMTSAYSAVFVGAHPDDIQLFMNKNVSVDIYGGHPTVLVLLTAGDAGNGNSGINSHGIPYYRARLNAHESSVRYWVSLIGGAVPKSIYSKEQFGAYSIEKVQIRNVVMYNLNLPDGNGDGSGFAATGNKSLAKLVAQSIPSVSSVDGANTYNLSQLKEVLRLIISRNNVGTPTVFVNYQDYDLVNNQGTHSDHKSTGDIVRMAVSENPKFACLGSAIYQDYIIAGFAENLTEAERNIHIGTWGALNAGLTNSGNENTWDPTHNAWLGRQYYRASVGSPCSF